VVRLRYVYLAAKSYIEEMLEKYGEIDAYTMSAELEISQTYALIILKTYCKKLGGIYISRGSKCVKEVKGVQG